MAARRRPGSATRVDEAPRLNSAAGDFGDLVSAVWENDVRDHCLMLVLSGSAVTVIEEMLGPHGGLHRRAAVRHRTEGRWQTHLGRVLESAARAHAQHLDDLLHSTPLT